MSNQATSTPTKASTSIGDGLPLVVVDRRELTRPAPGPWRQILYRIRFLPLAWALVVFGGIVGLYFQPPGLQFLFRTLGLTPGGGTSRPIAVPATKTAPEASALPARRTVVGLGKLVPAGDVITVAPPFGAGDGRIAKLAVKQGDRVEKGALLASLDNEATLKATIESARATWAAREASYQQTLASIRASRDEARAALERTQATARNAERDFERIDQLYKKGLTATATYEQKRTLRDETAREVEKAKATLSRWESMDPATHPDAVVARRNIDAAKADLARAESELDKAYVTAPIAGTVLTINVHPGERPGTQGILNLGNIDVMTVEVEVYQTQIGAVAVGDAVTITAEALGSTPLTGTVTRIGLEVGRQVLVDPNPAANTDARVVKVYVALEPASSARAQRFTNLQVLARIAVKGELR
jgi:HlyD family secretion protein